jgi:hypothetical protein
MNYYRLTIRNFGEYFEFGNSVTEVIATVRRDFELTARRAGLEPRPLGALSVRRAVYKEWNYSPEQYTNGGSFTHLYN